MCEFGSKAWSCMFRLGTLMYIHSSVKATVAPSRISKWRAQTRAMVIGVIVSESGGTPTFQINWARV
jgi:hypothetical protein